MTLRTPLLALLPALVAGGMVLALAPQTPGAALAAGGLLLVTAGVARLADGATGRVLGVVAAVLLLRLTGAVALALLLPASAIPAYAMALGLGILIDGVLLAQHLPRLTGSAA